MAIIAGVDIGNSTTEVCLARIDAGQPLQFLASSIVKTTGIKGTLANVPGIVQALQDALKKTGLTMRDLSQRGRDDSYGRIAAHKCRGKRIMHYSPGS